MPTHPDSSQSISFLFVKILFDFRLVHTFNFRSFIVHAFLSLSEAYDVYPNNNCRLFSTHVYRSLAPLQHPSTQHAYPHPCQYPHPIAPSSVHPSVSQSIVIWSIVRVNDKLNLKLEKFNTFSLSIFPKVT